MTGTSSPTMYVLDSISHTRFLVDSGAEISLLPASPADRARPCAGPALTAANGSHIPSFGHRSVTFCLSNHTFTWKFVLAAVPVGILGADFLRNNSLLVDLARQCLFHWQPDPSRVIFKAIKGFHASHSHSRISLVHTPPCPFQQMLRDRPRLTTPVFDAKQPAHRVQLHIPTSGPPVFARARRLSPEKLAVAKKEFKLMEQLGIIRRSTSPWASPLHIVGKKDGGYRPCGDFRRLNNITTPDKYPIPYLSDANHFLAGKTVFSKVDLVRGYHQIPVAAEDVAKTAICTPFGAFEFLRTPFGLKNAAQAFQRLMDQVAGDLPYLFIYLDDILVASSSKEEHSRHLTELFDRLESFGLIINPDKCEFAVPRLEFLGHMISAAGSAPLPAKVQAVADFPPPSTVLQMLQFVGLVNFYNRFVPHLNLIMTPLFASTAGKKKTELITWSEELSSAFSATKDALASATLLSHPLPDAPTAVTTDASDLGVGAVLEQKVGNSWRPLAFFSKKLTPAQTKYSAFDRELLAVHLAIRHFHYFLEGRQFVIYTDHKPLTAALVKPSEPLSPRQSRHLAAIAEFTADIRHVQGKLNPVADALSRSPTAVSALPPVPNPPPGVLSAASVTASATDLPALSAAQASDISLMNFVRNYNSDKLRLGPVTLPDSPGLVWCELSRPAPRPLVPEGLRRPITAELHALSHPGVKATIELVKNRFFWPNLTKDVKAFVSSCIPCKKPKLSDTSNRPHSSSLFLKTVLTISTWMW